MQSDSEATTRVVGRRLPRVDGRAKVMGATRYAADVSVPGTLWARIVPSVYAHSLIRSIDSSAARGLQGVVAVLTANDLPVVGKGPGRRYEPLVRREVVFAGQPVALVVAESEAIAQDALALVSVDEEPLPAVVDARAAMAPDAPPFRLDPVGDSPPDDPLGNVFSRERTRRGDAAGALARAELTVEGSFSTGWAYQGYLEPHTATAWLDPDGSLVVLSSTQAAREGRNALARTIYGLPTANVRVVPAPIGGAFGSKHIVLEPLVAGATLALRRPIQLTLTRQEDIAATNPAQGLLIDLRIGASRTGEFEALEARLLYDAGAYKEESAGWNAPMVVTGPYRWPAFDVLAEGVQTNRFAVGNYRAPTGPQGVFALESLVDELAERLMLDPVALRRLNLAGPGDVQADERPWPVSGARECLDRLSAHPAWTERASRPAGEGTGLAIGIWHGAAAPAAATCRVEPDGTITVVTGAVDVSGSSTGLAALAAETFGLPPDAVTVITADTSIAPFSPPSVGSLVTYGVGPAVQGAVAEARERVLQLAAAELEIAPGDLEIIDGIVRPRDAPHLGRSLAEIARGFDIYGSPHPPLEGHSSTAHATGAPSASGHLARVRVDDETGTVELLEYVVVQDVGRALNPAIVEGQMHGGAVQSIGRALREELVHDATGQLLTGTFLDYAMPRASALPSIETLIVEVPAPEGPFGARGIGESSVLCGPAAIANAIAAARGVRMRELPMTPPRVRAAIRAQVSDEPSGSTGDPLPL